MHWCIGASCVIACVSCAGEVVRSNCEMRGSDCGMGVGADV